MKITKCFLLISLIKKIHQKLIIMWFFQKIKDLNVNSKKKYAKKRSKKYHLITKVELIKNIYQFEIKYLSWDKSNQYLLIDRKYKIT